MFHCALTPAPDPLTDWTDGTNMAHCALTPAPDPLTDLTDGTNPGRSHLQHVPLLQGRPGRAARGPGAHTPLRALRQVLSHERLLLGSPCLGQSDTAAAAHCNIHGWWRAIETTAWRRRPMAARCTATQRIW